MNRISVEGRMPGVAPEMQQVLRELVDVMNVLAGRVFVGTGTPESVIKADKGSIYLRTDGGATTTLYVKTADAGLATGWTAK